MSVQYLVKGFDSERHNVVAIVCSADVLFLMVEDVRQMKDVSYVKAIVYNEEVSNDL